MQLPEPLPLSALVQSGAVVRIVRDTAQTVRSIIDDSRAATHGALFIVLQGGTHDGITFIRSAIAQGAVAILVDESALPRVLQELPDDKAVGILVTANVRRAMAQLAAWAAGHPANALELFGITGTNGKTTTSYFVAAILAEAGIAVGRIGTLGAAYADVNEEIGFTTPPPLALHALLARMHAASVRAVVMEVSSHALALERVAGLTFTRAAFTNMTRDHLDFHETFDAYRAAKRILFTQAQQCVLNLDDEVGRQYFSEFAGIGYTLESTTRDATLRAREIHLAAQGSRFMVGDLEYTLALPGRFQSLML